MAVHSLFNKVEIGTFIRQVICWIRFEGTWPMRWRSIKPRKEPVRLNNLEWSELYPMSTDNFHGGGGLYSLYTKIGNTYELFYIGQSKSVVSRLYAHMGIGSKLFMRKRNPCVKEHLEKYDCYYRFVRVENWATRNKLERQLIAKYKPTCNRVAGITRRPTKTMTNTIRNFLKKQPASWGPLESDSEKLYFSPYYESESVRREERGKPFVVPDWMLRSIDDKVMPSEEMPSMIVIGEWDGEIIITPDIDEKWISQNVIRIRKKLMAMAAAKGIEVRKEDEIDTKTKQDSVAKRRDQGLSYSLSQAKNKYECFKTRRPIQVGEYHFVNHSGKRFSIEAFKELYPERAKQLMEKRNQASVAKRRDWGLSYSMCRAKGEYKCHHTERHIHTGEYHFVNHHGKRLCVYAFKELYPEWAKQLKQKSK